MAHGRDQELFDFILSVPQTVLYRPEGSGLIAEVQVCVEQKRVAILLERDESPLGNNERSTVT